MPAASESIDTGPIALVMASAAPRLNPFRTDAWVPLRNVAFADPASGSAHRKRLHVRRRSDGRARTVGDAGGHLVSVLFTIGYQGSDLDALVRVLTTNGVQEVVDVRLTPISRKPGFSKSALAATLGARGIAYQHDKNLGCPKEIRLRYQETGSFQSYARSYRHRVLTHAVRSVEALARRAAHHRLCLLCFEENALLCHRSLVADETRTASQRRVRIDHLAVPSSGRTCR